MKKSETLKCFFKNVKKFNKNFNLRIFLEKNFTLLFIKFKNSKLSKIRKHLEIYKIISNLT